MTIFFILLKYFLTQAESWMNFPPVVIWNLMAWNFLGTWLPNEWNEMVCVLLKLAKNNFSAWPPSIKKRKNLLLFLAEAQQVISSTKIEVQNQPASFSCYDPAVADRYDDFYVQVYFKSLNDQAAADVMIAKYLVILVDTTIIHNS